MSQDFSHPESEREDDRRSERQRSAEGQGAVPQEPLETETLETLVPVVYRELRTLARRRRASWQGPYDPDTTSLVHEAYARLAEGPHRIFRSRPRFFAVVSKTMRSVLVDNARRYQRKKRGEGAPPLPLDQVPLVSENRCEELLILDEALGRLEGREPSLVQVVELRCFCGLSVQETAEALALSTATVKRRWALAKALLHRDLEEPDHGRTGRKSPRV